MATTTPVKPAGLEVNADPEAKTRPTIGITYHGLRSEYQLAAKGDLGIADQAKLQRLVAQWELVVGGNAAELTDEQAEALERNLAWAITVLVRDLPAEVAASLNDDARVQILMAFSNAVEATQAASTKSTKRTPKS